MFMGGRTREKATERLLLSREQLSRAVGLVVGHYQLMKHLYQVGRAPNLDNVLEMMDLHLILWDSAEDQISRIWDTYNGTKRRPRNVHQDESWIPRETGLMS